MKFLQVVQPLLPDLLEILHSLWTSWLATARLREGKGEVVFAGAPLTGAAFDMLSDSQISVKENKLKALQLRLAVQQYSR